MIVLGVDPDTKAITAVAVDTERPTWFHVTRLEAKGRRAEDRIQALASQIETWPHHTYDWVYIETPVMGVNVKALRDQAFVVGMLRYELWRRGQAHSLVDNGTWKKAVLGGGKASKEEIADYAIQRFSMTKEYKQDVYDATCIALFGLSTVQGGN